MTMVVCHMTQHLSKYTTRRSTGWNANSKMRLMRSPLGFVLDVGVGLGAHVALEQTDTKLMGANTFWMAHQHVHQSGNLFLMHAYQCSQIKFVTLEPRPFFLCLFFGIGLPYNHMLYSL